MQFRHLAAPSVRQAIGEETRKPVFLFASVVDRRCEREFERGEIVAEFQPRRIVGEEI